jgi:hypothetical protein
MKSNKDWKNVSNRLHKSVIVIRGTTKKQNEATEIRITIASFPMIYQVSTLVTSVGGFESPTEFFYSLPF